MWASGWVVVPPSEREGQEEPHEGGERRDALGMVSMQCLRDIQVEMTNTQLGSGSATEGRGCGWSTDLEITASRWFLELIGEGELKETRALGEKLGKMSA